MSQTMTLDKDKVLGLWEGGSTAVADWWDTHVHPTSPQNCGGVGLATSDHTAHLRPPARSASAALGVPPTLARARRFSSARSGCSIKLKRMWLHHAKLWHTARQAQGPLVKISQTAGLTGNRYG